MKQTAVEWQHIELSKFLYGKSEFTDANDILIKAKEMEKEQMCQFAFDYQDVFYNNGKVPPVEHYYNETFKTNDK
jgi:hypothetical protein